MATTSRDVNLIVRAKDEASKTFDTVAQAIAALVGANDAASLSARGTASDLKTLVDAAVSLDKAYGQITDKADKASAAFDRQRANIDGQKAALQSLQQQAEASAAAIQATQVAIVDKGLLGDTAGQAALRDQLKAAQVEAGRLDSQIAKLTSTIATSEAAIEGQRSNLQRIGSVSIAAEEAQRNLAAAINQVTQAQQAQARAAQVLPTIEASTGLTRDRSEYEQLIAQIHGESEAHDQLIAKLKAEQEARTQLAQTQDAQARAAFLLPGDTTTGKSARDSASVFTAADRAADEAFAASLQASAKAALDMDAATQRLRNQLNPLIAIQEKLNVELAEANSLYKAGRITAEELAAAETLLRGQADLAAQKIGRAGAGSNKLSLFGLTPYEITNLGYQINDVVTQLASGTSLTQTLAQQGGQILQIFPKAGAAIIGALKSPPVLLFAASLGLVVATAKKLEDEAANIREFQAALDATADSSAANAKALAEDAKSLDEFGLKATDAVTIVRSLLSDGINPARITEFGKAAQNMADVLGIKVTDAAKKLGDGFTGGYEAVKKLDQATNFLSASERDHIRTLFDENQAQEARNEAFRIFAEKYGKAAEDMRGPWASAVRSLHGAWSEFLDSLAGTAVVDGAVGALDRLAGGVSRTLDALSGRRTLKDVDTDITETTALIALLKQQQKEGAQVNELLANRVQHLKDLNAERTKMTAGGSGDTQAQGTQAQAKATEDLREETAGLLADNKKLSDQQRIDAAIKTANAEVDKKLAEDGVKLADQATQIEYRRAAVAKARQETEKKISDEKDAQNRKDEQAIKSFAAKVPGIEASGLTSAKNPNSSATGLGQFTAETWLELFRKYFPDEAAHMGQDAILALRKDSTVTKALIEEYARQNAEVLKNAGQSVTEANLYLAHFLGPGGALKVLQAAPGTPVSSLLSRSAINANRSVLQGKTAGDVVAFAQNRTGDTGAAVASAETHLLELEKERQATQDKFNKGLETEGALRQQQIAERAKEIPLQDTALLAAQKEAEVADAVAKLQKQVDDQNAARKAKGEQEIVLTQQQKDAVAKLAAAWFDVAHARDEAQAKTNEVTRPVNDLTAEQEALRSGIQQLQSLGDYAGANKLRVALDDVNAKLRDAIDAEITFYENLDPATDPLHRTREAIDATILHLKQMKTGAQEWGTVMGLSSRDIANTFASTLTNSVNSFFQKLSQGEHVFQALGESVREFASNFLLAIAQMLTQLLAFAAAVEILRALGVPIPSSGPNFIPTHHTGGLIGQPRTAMRAASPSWFAGAMKYHTGGLIGLAPDEVPMIGKRGEEVLTETDPRHRNNLGKNGARGAQSLKIVNLLDPADLLAAALATTVGEQVILNHVRQNSSAYQAALNGG